MGLQELVNYWTTKYSWRNLEKKINAIPQFKTRINDINLHFIHSQSQHPEAIPLLFIHGWPGSYLEVMKVLPLLTGVSYSYSCRNPT
jgi:epoxide hydrolase